MKKISIMFLLVLALSFMACMQAETGGNTTGTPQEVSDEEMTEEEKKARAEQLAVETAEAFKALKNKRDEYDKKMTDAKKAYEDKTQDTSQRHDILLLDDETKKFTKDKDKIHASLGYDNETIENLDKLIGFLQLSASAQDKTEEKKIVTDILASLVELEDTTKKIMDDHLKEDNLRKIENHKDKIDTANKELDGFIASRTAFVEDIKKTIKKAESASSSEAEVKAELKKIADTEPATNKPDEAGYFHTKLEAIKKNAIALDNLMK